jgi:superfamily II DNA/RNA helicase
MTEPKFVVGDLVTRSNAADEFGVVRQVQWNPQARGYSYSIQFGQMARTLQESALRPLAVTRSPWQELEAGTVAGDRAFRASLTRHRVTRSPSRIAKSFSSARTQFYPHQFKPLLKLLDSARKRVLIADDVGLGKTIEAGYVLLELEAAQRLPHVLVVAPSRLLTKWKDELSRRFDQKFEIVRTNEIRAALSNDRSPPEFRWITSYETLRRIRENLEQSPLSIDCLFLDEAHKLRNSTTETHKLGALLCERAEAVVMLSATPIQTSLSDLYHLARLLLPEEYASQTVFIDQMEDNQLLIETLHHIRLAHGNSESATAALRGLDGFLETRSGRAFAEAPQIRYAREVLSGIQPSRAELTEVQATVATLSPINDFFTRTRKEEAIPNTPKRDCKWQSVKLTAKEREIYDLTVTMCRALASDEGWGADQSAIMMYRAVASCIPAAMRYFLTEDGDLASSLEDQVAEEPLAPPPPSQDVVRSLRRQIRDATALFSKLGATDTKYDIMLRFLDSLWQMDDAQGRPRRKCIVFSYFRGTVEYLADRLSEEPISNVRVHGGIPTKDRETIVEPFRSGPDVRVLVTSDVSAEGVDLQMASVVINYDLPWNPMVIEQRIGRIDRIGQESRTLEIANLVVEDSIEMRILKRLFQRVKLIESSIGEVGGILGDIVPVEDLARRALLGTLTESEIAAEEARAGEVFESQQRMARELDARAQDLVAIDQAIRDEIDAATGQHQIPSERHIHEFLNQALDQAGAGAILDERALQGVVRFDFRSALASVPYQPGPGDTERGRFFMQRAHHGPVDITLSREVGYRHPQVEIIHATHPLVRWAAGPDKAPALAFSLQLPGSRILRDGRYAWAVSFLDAHGGAVALRMMGAFLSMEDPSLVVRDSTDVAVVVGELLDGATSLAWPWRGETISNEARMAIEATKIEIGAIVHRANERDRERHALREATRHARTRSSHVAALERAELLLRQYEDNAARPFVRNMQEKKVDVARRRLQTFDESPATSPWADLECIDVAVGVLQVGDIR